MSNCSQHFMAAKHSIFIVFTSSPPPLSQWLFYTLLNYGLHWFGYASPLCACFPCLSKHLTLKFKGLKWFLEQEQGHFLFPTKINKLNLLTLLIFWKCRHPSFESWLYLWSIMPMHINNALLCSADDAMMSSTKVKPLLEAIMYKIDYLHNRRQIIFFSWFWNFNFSFRAVISRKKRTPQS